MYGDSSNYNLGFYGYDEQTGRFKILYLGYELEPEDNKTVDIQSGVIFYYIDLHAIVPVNHAPNTPSNPDPDDGATGVSIDKVLSWSGGDPDSGDTVTYDVYFGTINPPLKKSSNQSGTSYDPGTLDYETTYYWKIVAWDNHGASIPGPIWQFTTAETSPTVKITKPICKSIYFRNRYIPRLLMPGVIIIGTIDIEASVLDDGGISMVKFYIDDQPRYTDYEEPYNWTWNERIFFRHTIKVVAYDIDGNIAEDSIVVRIFNLNK